MISNKQTNKRGDRRARQNKRSGQADGDRLFVSSHFQSSKFDSNFVTQDLTHKPPTKLVPTSIPRNILNQIVWLQSQMVFAFDTSTTIETGFSRIFQLSQLPIASEVSTLFDQYMIYAVTINMTCNDIVNGEALVLYTAVDFDGQNFLTPPTSSTAIMQYSTSNVAMLTSGKSVTRFLKPCVASALYNNTGVTNGYGADRIWCDSASPDVPWYGLVAVAGISNQVIHCQASVSYVLAARNNH
jgi:hypothetical protein